MFNKKNVFLIIFIFLMSLSVVSAVEFDIPSGYYQSSSSVSMAELENNAGEYILITDGNYISYEDIILDLGNDYVISNIKDLEIANHDVKEYTLSSKDSTVFVYTFKHWGHVYNIGIAPNNILFWNAESSSNPIYQIISSFS